MKSPATAFVITHESDPNRTEKGCSLIALAVTRSIGRMGVPVVRVHPNLLDYSLSSRFCSEISICPDMYKSESALVDFLLELAQGYEGRRVLLPASDDCAQFLGKYRSALEPAYAVCVTGPSVIDIVMNKQRQYAAAEDAGVPIPETYFPKSLDQLEEIIAQATNYPYIIKPLVAHEWRLASMKQVSKGRKAIRVASADELREAYRSIEEGRDNVMIQEVIGGRDEQLFTFLAYFSRDSIPLAYCVRSKVRQRPIDFGYCTNTVSCHNQVVVDQSIRLLQGIGYSGICGVEFKYDSSTGSHKLIEINARPVNTIGIAPACGVNIPYIAFMDLLGEPPAPVTNWKDGIKWFQIWADFFAARELRSVSGHPTLSEWFRSVRGESVDAVYSGDDLLLSFRYFFGKLAGTLAAKLARAFRTSDR